MIEDRVVTTLHAHAVERRAVTEPDSHVAHDHVVNAGQPERRTSDADAFARSSLPRDRDVALAHREARSQAYGPADVEHDRARTTVGLDRVAQAARPGVVEVRDVHDLAVTSTDRKAPVPFRRRKRELPRP